VLLDARRRMRNRPPLVLIGTPRADTPHIDDPEVVIARNVPSEQVMASWMRASAAVVPSVVKEGMGQVAIEAMLVGRPVVASDIGGLRDVVEDGVTGLLVPPGNPEPWRLRWTACWTIRRHGSGWARLGGYALGVSRPQRWCRG